MVQCTQCGAELGETARRGEAISGSMLGDEWTEIWFLCESCACFSVKVVCEPFFGDDQVSVRGPVARQEGEAKLRLIRQCATPWDKKCRCAAHREYFDGNLD